MIFFTGTVPLDAAITSITSDEAVDAAGDGRVYHVNYATPAGDLGTCDFVVPHDQGPAHGAVDSGVVLTVTR